MRALCLWQLKLPLNLSKGHPTLYKLYKPYELYNLSPK